ncbi:MAG: hypothetical protein OHK0029_14630 [Armatimonadaceae bacterium]
MEHDSDDPVLEIRVHQLDGTRVRFAQNDIEQVRRLIQNLQPARVFANDLIMIGDVESLTAFPSHRVVRVDFIANKVPEFAQPLGVSLIAEADIEECQKHSDRTQTVPSLSSVMADSDACRYAQVELNDGSVVCLEVQMAPADRDSPLMQRTAMDQPALLARLFNTNGLHLRRRGGGMSILNPKQFGRITIYPYSPVAANAVMPAGVWEANQFEVQREQGCSDSDEDKDEEQNENKQNKNN